MNETDAFVDRALAARLAAEEAVDVAGPQARKILGRRNDAVADVLVGIEPVRGE